MLSKKFICATYDYSTYQRFVPSPFFRKSFSVNKTVSKCTVTIGGLGFYDVFINGQKITKGIIAPYVSNPDHIVYFDEYDVTRYLCEGKNVLGIQLGNGMQNCPGGEIWDFEKASFRGAPRVAFSIETEYLDGTVEVLEADKSVKTAPSPIIFDDLRCGCFYDARNEIPNWSEIDFCDDKWDNALIAEAPRGERRICEAEPVVPLKHIRPVSIRKCTLNEFRADKRVDKNCCEYPSKERTGWLYDFGITTAGIIRLKIKGYRGQKVDLQFGEYLDENGNPDYSNVQFLPEGYSQRDIYVLKGEGEEVFEPQFTYHGFRYVVVLGISEEQATEALLTCIICSSALEERGNFICSDDVLNKLQAMARNATVSNFYYFPTDCPQREKNGWTGDAVNSCRQTHLNLNPDKSYKEWLRNIRKAQRAQGDIPGVVPTDEWGYNIGPAWDAVLTHLPYFTYLYRGDKEILEENADALFRYAVYIAGRRTKRGTIDYGLGDWCPVTVVKAPVEFTSSVMTMDILKKCSYIFNVLGRSLQKDFCDKVYNEVRAAVRKYFVDWGSMTVSGNCQTSQSMAIFYDVFDESEKPQAAKVLVDIIKQSDDHIDFGFLGILTVFRVLCQYGECDLAYKMIARQDYPSFGDWVKRGFTSMPERFFRDGEFPDSLNHHAFADISAIFIEYFAGIKVNPYGDDCKEVNIEPCFVKALNNAAAFYNSVCGRVSVKWERTFNGIKLSVEIPEGIYGEIKLPVGYRFAKTQRSQGKLEGGVYEIEEINKIADNIIEV